MTSAYDDFEPQAANFVALSPVSFLKRAGLVFAQDEAVVYGDIRRNWLEVLGRVEAMAACLQAEGLGRNDTIAVLAPNVPEVFELHFAIPMSGAVINTINTRLDAETIAYILEHGEAKLVFCDGELSGVLKEAFAILGREIPVVDIESDGFGLLSYEDMVAKGAGLPVAEAVEDEWQALALNYTSGTSGRPKGVVYHHRGGYLMALSTIAAWSVPMRPNFLSVSPMFHCNGWNHPWAMAIVGAKMVFTRNPMPDLIFAAIAKEGITHFGAAPIVLAMLAESDACPEKAYDPKVDVMTAGAPPPPSVLEKMEAVGFQVMQVYGLTETYGHIAQCLWQENWAELPAAERAAMQARQGVPFPMTEDLAVIDRETMTRVPMDGVTQGEIAIRGNTVMKGYLKNSEASAESFQDGYFWSGDVAVVHPDGYMQVRDRLKDVIISGGENISSVEVETVLYRHEDVANAAVVAMPNEKWGESPCAFVELREGAQLNEADLIAFARTQLAGFKCPKAVVFGELPKTATGKIQKFMLREQAKDIAAQKQV